MRFTNGNKRCTTVLIVDATKCLMPYAKAINKDGYTVIFVSCESERNTAKTAIERIGKGGIGLVLISENMRSYCKNVKVAANRYGIKAYGLSQTPNLGFCNWYFSLRRIWPVPMCNEQVPAYTQVIVKRVRVVLGRAAN